ncbi:hypothetical protein ACRAWD_27110 [Caulobacter segnis]
MSSLGPQGAVYSIDPNGPKDALTLIQPTTAAAHAGAKTLLPVNWWNNGEFKDQFDPATGQFTTLAEMFARDVGSPKAQEYVSPDVQSFAPRLQGLAAGSSGPRRLALVRQPAGPRPHRRRGRRAGVRHQRVREQDLQRPGRARRDADRSEGLRQPGRGERRGRQARERVRRQRPGLPLCGPTVARAGPHRRARAAAAADLRRRRRQDLVRPDPPPRSTR